MLPVFNINNIQVNLASALVPSIESKGEQEKRYIISFPMHATPKNDKSGRNLLCPDLTTEMFRERAKRLLQREWEKNREHYLSQTPSWDLKDYCELNDVHYKKYRTPWHDQDFIDWTFSISVTRKYLEKLANAEVQFVDEHWRAYYKGGPSAMIAWIFFDGADLELDGRIRTRGNEDECISLIFIIPSSECPPLHKRDKSWDDGRTGTEYWDNEKVLKKKFKEMLEEG